MNKFVYEGVINLIDADGARDLVTLNNNSIPLVEKVAEDVGRKFCTVTYYINDSQFNDGEKEKYLVSKIAGELNIEYNPGAQRIIDNVGLTFECTEVLSIDDDYILNNIRANIGKYAYIAIEIDEKKEENKRIEELYKTAERIINESKSLERHFDEVAYKLGMSKKELRAVVKERVKI